MVPIVSILMFFLESNLLIFPQKICPPGFWPGIRLPNHCQFSVWSTNKNDIWIKDLQMSDEKKPGWLGDVGDYATHLYEEYNKPW